MAELTTSNIIKMIIAVFLIVLVLGGIYLSFKNYIIPYFTEEPEPQVDLPKAFLDTLVTVANRISLVQASGKYRYISMKNSAGQYDLSIFYIQEGKIWQDMNWALDKAVGAIGKDGKITITQLNLDDGMRTLSRINGNYRVKEGIFKAP